MATPLRVILCALSALFTITLWSVDADACTCERNIRPVADSEIVFWGTATDIRARGSQDRVTFEVSQIYKGEEDTDTVTVHTNRFHHDCGVRFEKDKTYMVYAYDFYPRGVATSLCWGTHQADEPVAEDAWTNVDVKAPEDTPIEVALRKIARDVAPECGASQRLFNTGFSMILSPDGDPVLLHEGPNPGPKHAAFHACVLDKFLTTEDLPRPEQPTVVHGWYQRDVRGLPVLLDEQPCGESCLDFTAQLIELLSQPKFPDDDSFKNRLFAEWDECVEGGISAVGEESPGSATQQKRRNRMLAECAVQRGEYEGAQPFVEAVEPDTLQHAVAWAIANGSADAPIPITSDVTFPQHAVAQDDGEVSRGELRKLRKGFILDREWAFSPIYLQAFAQSLLADDAATERMRDIASLALFRAGLIVPSAKDAFGQLARDASDTPDAQQLRDTLQKAWEAERAPPVAAAAEEVEEVVEAPTDDEPEPRDPMILVIAGILILVALGGIGAILRRRS